MGLLDDILGQVAGAPARRDEPQQGASSIGPIVTALLPVVMAMLSNRGQTQERQQTGGIGALLGTLLGGDGSTARAGGGLGALLDQLQRAGFGDQGRSWVGSGPNQAIPPDAFGRIFGDGGLAEIARSAGLSPQDTARGLSQLMPEVVDRMTPNGEMPDDAALAANVGALARRLGLT
jgi:uncharacterized protein YidB (DUF937 family)